MKELIVQFFLGASIKAIDEIADNQSLHQFGSYLKPLFIITAFLYGITSADDFYYHIFWLAWFFSAYFGQSMDNEMDNGFWKFCFILVLFALVYSTQFPLPKVYLPVFLPFLLFIGTLNIIENIVFPDEVPILKLIFSIVGLLLIPLLYFYFLFPIIQEKKEYDFRYLDKHLVLIVGYIITRILFKFYLLLNN